MQRCKWIVFLILILHLAGSALAAEESPADILFGPEFTFWLPDDVPYEIQRQHDSWNTGLPVGAQYVEHVTVMMHRHLVGGQPEGAKFSHSQGSTLFISPNGWNFNVATDPSVLEVTMKPLRVDEVERFAPDIQDAIFVSMANAGLFPSLFGGGGHINIGGSFLMDNPLLLANFLIDLINHNELALGILNYDTNNALPFDLMLHDDRVRLWSQLQEFANDANHQTLRQFANKRHLAHADWRIKDGFQKFWHPSDDTESRGIKFYAVNFNYLPGGGSSEGPRIELRAVRAQASADVWLRQIRLLQKRILFLAKLSTPLKIKPILKVQQPARPMEVAADEAMNPPVNPQKALRAFYTYVTESGENWNDHRDYIWPQWISSGELSKFEASSWFRKSENSLRGGALCSRLLGRLTP